MLQNLRKLGGTGLHDTSIHRLCICIFRSCGPQIRVSGKKLLDDVWHIDDLEAFIHNIFEAHAGTKNWKVWDYLDTQAMDPSYVWLK